GERFPQRALARELDRDAAGARSLLDQRAVLDRRERDPDGEAAAGARERAEELGGARRVERGWARQARDLAARQRGDASGDGRPLEPRAVRVEKRNLGRFAKARHVWPHGPPLGREALNCNAPVALSGTTSSPRRRRPAGRRSRGAPRSIPRPSARGRGPPGRDTPGRSASRRRRRTRAARARRDPGDPGRRHRRGDGGSRARAPRPRTPRPARRTARPPGCPARAARGARGTCPGRASRAAATDAPPSSRTDRRSRRCWSASRGSRARTTTRPPPSAQPAVPAPPSTPPKRRPRSLRRTPATGTLSQPRPPPRPHPANEGRPYRRRRPGGKPVTTDVSRP